MMASVFAGPVIAADILAPQSVLIVGDSLSGGYGIDIKASWPSLLAQHLVEQGYPQTVVNASISGETTSGGAHRIGSLVERHQPAVVIIALGANDGLRGLDVDETKKNVATMISVAQQAGCKVVLLKVRIPPNYGPQYTAAFEDVFERLGRTTGVIDAPFMLETFATSADAFQADGLHPTAKVQPEILKTLWPSIAAALDGEVSGAQFNEVL